MRARALTLFVVYVSHKYLSLLVQAIRMCSQSMRNGIGKNIDIGNDCALGSIVTLQHTTKQGGALQLRQDSPAPTNANMATYVVVVGCNAQPKNDR
jgi:hypothetical protein